MAPISQPEVTLSRKQVLLDAALACFSENGYTATTVDEVRARADASIGSLYHHFGSKERLASALYVDLLSRYEDGYLAVLNDAGGAQDGVRSVVRHHLEWAEGNPEGAGFLLGNNELEVALARSGDLPEQNRRFYGQVQTWVREHVGTGELRRLSADLYYALWIGPSQELTRQWLAGRSRTTPTAAAMTLADAAWGALGLPESG